MDIQGDLIRIAAECARGVGMPPEMIEDYRTRPTKESLGYARQANRQAIEWAQRLKKIADQMNE